MGEIGSNASVKQNNIAAIRDALYRVDFATKKEIAARCGLSLAACTALLAGMIADGQVLELAFAAPNGGRPARRFALNPDYAHILCLYTDNNATDGAGIALRICDLAGRVRTEKFCPLSDIQPDDLVALVSETAARDPLIRAVGIGIAGITDHDGRITGGSFHALNGFNPKAVLEEKLGVTVLTENDMYFTSYGFYTRNYAGRPYSLSVLYWPSHKCAGAGTVVNGHVIVGSTKYAGELVSLPFPFATLSKDESLARMIRGEDTVPLMGTAAACTIALINPDVIYLTGTATLNIRESDIIDYCKQTIPENHLPVFRIQADIHEEYMTGIFELARKKLPFHRL